jgi:hypothetical protein
MGEIDFGGNEVDHIAGFGRIPARHEISGVSGFEGCGSLDWPRTNRPTLALDSRDLGATQRGETREDHA